MMTEFNPVNLKKGIGLLGASEKLRTCLRATHRQEGNSGKKQGQPMSFACMMGQACGSMNGELTCGNLKSGFTVHCSRFTVDGIVKSYAFPRRSMGTRENILSAVKDKMGKTNQSLPVMKGKGLVKSPHSVILKGETAKDINPFMDVSKGRGAKTNGSLPGKVSLLPESGGQKQIKEKVENLPGSASLKKSKAEINHALTRDATGQIKQGLNKQSIESGLPKSGLIGLIAGKDEALKKSMGARVADPVGENLKTEKTAIAVSKDGRLKGSWVGRNSLAAGDAPGLLKFSLNKAAAAKENSAREPVRTEKNSFILAKNDGSGNEIKNLLKHQGLKSIEIAAEHEKTGIEKFSDYKIEVLPKASLSSSHSVDKISSAGAYHHAAFHAGNSSPAVNESAGSYGIEPRALIKQIADGVKRPGRVRIMLNPPRLGALDVDVLVRDNKVHVILQAENNDVRHILQSNIESLKSSLRGQGLIADNVNVAVQEKSDGGNYGKGTKKTGAENKTP